MMTTETPEIIRDLSYFHAKYGKGHGVWSYRTYVNTAKAYVEGSMESEDDECYGQCFFTRFQLDLLRYEGQQP